MEQSQKGMRHVPEKICIAMSGGVDSSVCALLLTRVGIPCTGATMVLGTPEDEANVASARAVCEQLGIPHEVFPLAEEFRRLVIRPFLDEHAACLTPNPCVTCNRTIKFGAFMRRAEEAGCARIATGHYLKVSHDDGRTRVMRAADARKDQSYFLSRGPRRALSRALFPVGDLSKPEVVQLAAEAGLPSAAREESQDVCFINGSCADFLRERLGTRLGSIVDGSGRVLGGHEGAHLFTIGQRKGLGVALGHPAYVCAKDADANQVVLGDAASVQVDTVRVRDLNWLTEPDGSTFACQAKVRYNMEPSACTVHVDDDEALLTFSSPVFAPAPGQTAAFYDGDLLLGGGQII